MEDKTRSDYTQEQTDAMKAEFKTFSESKIATRQCEIMHEVNEHQRATARLIHEHAILRRELLTRNRQESEAAK